MLGAQDDRICTPADAQRHRARITASTATILPGMAHMLMLEPEWETAAEALAEWLARNSSAESAARARDFARTAYRRCVTNSANRAGSGLLTQ